jgi:anhydro-N-acetylmuramic acid kinase
MHDRATPRSYRIIGLMSGSSLDGLDIACCALSWDGQYWGFEIEAAECAPYDDRWTTRLRNAHTLSGRDLWQLHVDFGRFSGNAVRDFIAQKNLQGIDAVGSHGHTVFHAPEQNFTTQIGDGAVLAAQCGLPVICDFRSADMAKNGQGAPLVPIGDRLLLGQYRYLLNLGGIANVTIQDGDKTLAFDIACANQLLNIYAQALGGVYDDKGQWAAQGALHTPLYDALNKLDYYSKAAPKSLDNGYSRDVVLPLCAQYDVTPHDMLHTLCEHIAYQIGLSLKSVISSITDDKMLLTGGGAYNDYLVSRIAHHTGLHIEQADPLLISYKEALVFAFLAALRLRGEDNILSSVTGAKANSVGGAIYLP